MVLSLCLWAACIDYFYTCSTLLSLQDLDPRSQLFFHGGLGAQLTDVCRCISSSYAVGIKLCFILHSNVAPGCEGRWHWLWIVDWIFGGVETKYDWPSCLQSLFYGTHLFLMTLVNSWILKDALNLCALRDRGIDAVLNCARDDCRELKLRMGTVQTLSFHRHSCLQRWSWDCLLQTTEVLAQGWFEIRRCGLKLMAGARDERGLILGMPQWGWHRAELSSKLDMASD